jgi:hypothetical protein
MDIINYILAYVGYIFISSAIAFLILKAKRQQVSVRDMVFVNTIGLGLVPIVALLIRRPPLDPDAAEAYDYYYKRKIWIWNKKFDAVD